MGVHSTAEILTLVWDNQQVEVSFFFSSEAALWSMRPSQSKSLRNPKRTIFMNLGEALFAGETVRQSYKLRSKITRSNKPTTTTRPGQGPPRNPGSPWPEPGDTGQRATEPTQSDPRSNGQFFLLERHLAQVAWSLSVLNLICIPQSTHALDQGGVEPRQAVSPRPEAKDDTASLQRRLSKIEWASLSKRPARRDETT